jgi:cysteine desulfurase family protein (TIGR01976 family)
MTAPTLDQVRARFPALSMQPHRGPFGGAGPMVLLENAGGSQVPIDVADAIRAYMLESYVQLGAGYPMSDVATAVVDGAHAFVETLFGGTGVGRAILGPSTTQLCHLLAGCSAQRLKPGDEIVLAETAHEANVGAWLRLRDAGIVVRWWEVDRATQDLALAGLERVLSPRTKIVAFPHVSNLLGGIVDVEGATKAAHAAGARVVVDGVAFAPHRTMDVARWNVDWYVYSTYKVYGPHMGALYGRNDAIDELEGPNHFFIPRDRVPYKFELGGANHEGCAALRALGPYLAFLAGESWTGSASRGLVERAFGRMTVLEEPLQRRLIEGLASIDGVRLVGSRDVSIERRVPTVSFLHDRRGPADVVAALRDAGIAVRHGHMYAYRLCEALGIDVGEGVVRASAVHYNTIDEIDRLLDTVRRL